MEEALDLIEKIIGEHGTIVQNVQILERMANDTEAIGALEKVQEAFKPGRLEEKQELQKLQGVLQTLVQRLQAHFNREETGLLAAFEKNGDKKLTSAFTTLLIEHEDLRNRLARSKRHVAELIDGGLSRQVWEARVLDMQAHISRTRQLLEAHAEIEQELLQELRKGLHK